MLGAHVAGVEEDDLCVVAGSGEIELAAEDVVGEIGLRVYCVDVDPVGKEDCVARWDAFGEGALEHLGGDAGDAGERAGEELFEGQRERVDGSLSGEEAEVEGGVYLEILHVKPGGSAGGLCGEQRDGSAEESGLDGEDDLGLPEELPQNVS